MADNLDCFICNKKAVGGEVTNSITCDGYCRRSFHISCLKLDTGIAESLRTCKEFLFFCEDCRNLFKKSSMDHRFAEAEKSLSGLVKSIRTAAQTVDEFCKKAVSTITTKEKTARPASSMSPVLTRSRRAKAASFIAPKMLKTRPTATTLVKSARPENSPKSKDVVFSTPVATPTVKTKAKSFFGTSDTAGEICGVEERRSFVISRIGPSMTADRIVHFIKEKTEIEARCQLLLPKGRSVDELDFVSFKISVSDAERIVLMKPGIWPGRVLVREFFEGRKIVRRSAVFPVF